MASNGLTLIVNELSQIQSQIQSLSSNSKKLSNVFAGADTGATQLSNLLTRINNLMVSYQTNTDKNGKISVSASKNIIKEYESILKEINQINTAESNRMDSSDFSTRMNQLKQEQQLLEKRKNTIEEQLKIEKQKKVDNSTNNLYAKAGDNMNALGRAKLTQLQNQGVTPDQLKIAAGTNKDAIAMQQQLGLNETFIQSLRKTVMEIDRNYESAKNNITELTKESKDATKSIKKNAEEIENLNKRGIQTPGSQNTLNTTKDTLSGQIGPLQQQVTTAEQSGSSTINLNDINKPQATLASLTKNMMAFRMVMMYARQAIQYVVQTIKQMDEALVGMTVVTGKSKEEVNELIPQMRELANVTSATMTEVSNLTTEYLRQGRTMQEALILTEATANAAKISGLSTQETIEYMTSAINGFTLAATDAERVSDIFANVAAVSATDYEDLAVALSKVSAQANLAGMSIEYTTALLAKGIETTQEAPESIGTALKTVVARMRQLTEFEDTLEDGTDVNKVETALAAAGIALRDQAGEFRNLELVFNELGAQWDNLTGMQQQAIAQASAGTRQQSRFIAIMQDWSRTLELVEESQNSAGAAAYQHSQYEQGLTATMDRLKNSAQGFINVLVDTDAVVDILDIVGDTLNDIVSLTENFEEEVRNIISGVVIIGGIMAANKGLQTIRLKLLQRELVTVSQLSIMDQIKYNASKKSLMAQKAQEKVVLKNLGLEKDAYKTKVLDLLTEKDLTEEKIKQTAFDILKQQGQVENLTMESAEVALLSQQLKQSMGIAAIEQSRVATGGLKYTMDLLGYLINKKMTIETYNQIAGKKSLTLLEFLALRRNKKRLASEGAVTVAKWDQVKAEYAAIVPLLLILAALAAIVALVIAIVNSFKQVSKAQENIIENNNKIYDATRNQSGLEKLIEEYEDLDKKVNKTAEDIERMAEIEKDMRDNYKGVSPGGARERLLQYSQEIYEANHDNLKQFARAYALEGVKILDTKEFKEVLQGQLQSKIEIHLGLNGKDLSADQLQYAKEKGQEVLSSIDYNAIAKDARKYSVETVNAGERWAKFGRIMSEQGSVGGLISQIANLWHDDDQLLFEGTSGFGQVMGWILDPIGNAFTYINKAQNAKQAAKKTEQIMNETAQQISQYSISMANALEDSSNRFAAQYEAYTEALAGDFNSYTKNAIKEQDSYLEVYSSKYGEYAEEIADAFDWSVSELNTLVSSYYESGVEAAQGFIQGIKDGIDQGGSVGEIIGHSIEELYDSNSNFRKSLESRWKGEYAYRTARLEKLSKMDPSDADKIRKYIKNNPDLGITSYDPYEALLQADKQLTELGKESDYFNQQTELLVDKMLETVSPYASLLEVGQAVTTQNSINDTFNDYIEAARKGELTEEQIQDILTRDEFKDYRGDLLKYISEGDYNSLAATLSAGYKQVADSVLNIYDRYIQKLEDQKIKNIQEGQENLNEALDEEIEVVKALIEEYGRYNKVAYETLIQTNRLAVLEKEISKGFKGSAEEANKILDIQKQQKENEIDLIIKQNQLNSVAKQYFKDIKNGIMTWNQFDKATSTWSEGQKAAFKKIYETVKGLLDGVDEMNDKQLENIKDEYKAIEELQNNATELLKSKYQKEYDSLKNSLDKRKELYEKYFDDINKEDETKSYEEEYLRLQNAINNLSTSNDAASLAKRKEYEEELLELEQERSETVLENLKDAALSRIETESAIADEEYNKLIEDTRKLWEEYGNMTRAEQEDLFLNYKEGFKNATDEARATMWIEFTEMMNNIKGVSLGETGYIDPRNIPNLTLPTRVLTGSYTAPKTVAGTNSTTNNSQVTIDGITVVLQSQGSGYSQQDANSFVQFLQQYLIQSGINVNLSTR